MLRYPALTEVRWRSDGQQRDEEPSDSEVKASPEDSGAQLSNEFLFVHFVPSIASTIHSSMGVCQETLWLRCGQTLVIPSGCGWNNSLRPSACEYLGFLILIQCGDGFLRGPVERVLPLRHKCL